MLPNSEKNRVKPIWVLVLTDVIAVCAVLLVWAYFDHVYVRGNENDASVPDTSRATSHTTTTASAKVSTETKPSVSVSATTPTTWETAPQPTRKFEDKFATGETVLTDTFYRTEHVSVEQMTVYAFDSNVHIQDIYIDVDYITDFFLTAFSDEKYTGKRKLGSVIADENDAVCSINGDFPGFGQKKTNVIIRNGILYEAVPFGDVLVMYKDGTMKAFRANKNNQVPEFDGNAEMANGAWQAWCFGPSFIEENGEARTSFSNGVNPKNPRTVIGYFEPGHYCFVVIEGRSDASKGMTTAEVSKFMVSLGCVCAYNFDGGQSSTMTFFDKTFLGSPTSNEREINDIIFIAKEHE